MKKFVTLAALAATAAGSAHAGGIDRSGQGIGILFEQGRMLELSFGSVSPKLSGSDIGVPAAAGQTGDIAKDYTQIGLAFKDDINARLSYAVILDQPFGADSSYGGGMMLRGTRAKADSTALTGLLRYKFDGGFSVHGGLRLQQSKASIGLRGLAYGALSGYDVSMKQDTGVGYVAGLAWERPEIAARVALTYQSEVKHKFSTTERGGPFPTMQSVTTVTTPQSWNLDLQTGIMADTLLFGQIRWVDWSEFQLKPSLFARVQPQGLVNLEDTTTYTLGVARKFNETWSGAVSVTYEDQGKRLVSPLAPTTGRLGATLAAVYTHDNMKVTAGVNYTKLGNAFAQTANTARSSFSGNSAVGFGLKVGFRF